MKTELFEKYAVVKTKIKQLQKEADLIAVQVQDEMIQNDVKTHKTDLGSFTIGYRKTWKYSDAIKEMSDSLKIAQIDEQEEGIAEVSEKPFLTYKK